MQLVDHAFLSQWDHGIPFADLIFTRKEINQFIVEAQQDSFIFCGIAQFRVFFRVSQAAFTIPGPDSVGDETCHN